MAVHRVCSLVGEYQEFKEPLRGGAVIELEAFSGLHQQHIEVDITNGTNPLTELFVNIVVKNKTKNQSIEFSFDSVTPAGMTVSERVTIFPGQSELCQINHQLVKGWKISEVSPIRPARSTWPNRDWDIVTLIVTGIIGVVALVMLHLFTTNHNRTV